jgi:hypothetical protein
MEAAFTALGKKLVVTVVDESQTMVGRTKDRVSSSSAFSAKWRRKPASSVGVQPGVLLQQARPVGTHAASRLTAGRQGTARKAAKKR